MEPAGRVTVYEVGPRDGLQNEPDVLEPDVRAELVTRLVAAGVRAVEIASFVDPRRVPQMAGAEEVAAAVERREGVVYAGLALNERGYERLVAAGLGEARFAFGVTESFNRRNQGASVEESLAAAETVVARARADGLRSTVTLSVAFGCPFEGAVDPGHVAALAERIAEAGPDALVLADTIGVAVPREVRALTERVTPLGPTRAAPATRTPWPRSRPARPCWTRRSAGSAAVPSRRARPGTSPPRTSSTSCTARGSRRASSSRR